MLTREQAINAYRRVGEWERRQQARLNATILKPFFGGCGCRLHNCIVAYEWGQDEGSSTINGRTYRHRELVKLAKRYLHEQRAMWDKTNRLQAAFARYF